MTTSVAFWEDAREEWSLVRGEITVLAIRDVRSPYRHQLTKMKLILDLRIPQPHLDVISRVHSHPTS
jgi:hypothetical protein